MGGTGGCSHPIPPPPKLPKHQFKRHFIFRTYYQSEWSNYEGSFDVGKKFKKNKGDLILIGFQSEFKDLPKSKFLRRSFQFFFAESKSVTYVHEGGKIRDEKKIFVPSGGRKVRYHVDFGKLYVNDLFSKLHKGDNDDIREFRFKLGNVNVS